MKNFLGNYKLYSEEQEKHLHKEVSKVTLSN